MVTAAVSVNVVNNSSVGVIPAAFNLINVSVKSSTPNCVLVANLEIKLNASAPASALPVTDVNAVLKSWNLAVVFIIDLTTTPVPIAIMAFFKLMTDVFALSTFD